MTICTSPRQLVFGFQPALVAVCLLSAGTELSVYVRAWFLSFLRTIHMPTATDGAYAFYDWPLLLCQNPWLKSDDDDMYRLGIPPEYDHVLRVTTMSVWYAARCHSVRTTPKKRKMEMVITPLRALGLSLCQMQTRQIPQWKG